MLRKTFGPERDEMTVEWRRLHNEEHCAVYSSLHIIQEIKSRRMRWMGNVTCMGKRKGSYRASVGRPGGRRPLRRPGRRWENNIKINLQKVGWRVMDWNGLAQDRDRWRTLVWAGSVWLRLRTGGGHLCGLDRSGSG